MEIEIFVYLLQIMLSVQYCAMFSQAIRDTAHTQKYTPHVKRHSSKISHVWRTGALGY